MSNENRVTRVYRFGLLPPTENEQLIRGQLRLAHKYRNTLTEIERARRAEVRKVISSHGSIPVLEAAAKAAGDVVDDLLTKMRAAKSKDRTRVVDKEAKEALKVARDSLREAKAVLWSARSALRADPDVAAAKDEIESRYVALRKVARAESGLYWGTYILVEAADDASRKMPLYDGIEDNSPRFTRWDGQETLGVQVQNGVDATDLDSTTLVRIEDRDAPAGVDPTSKRSAKRRYATLAMRVGSGEKRAAIWGRWPMVMHRPFPENAVIKRAAVHVRLIGPREEWCVLFTVQMDAPVSRVPDGAPRVAIDLGWRAEEEFIRVAAWRTDEGQKGFLRLPPRLLSQLQKADDLQSIRAKNLTLATTLLTQYLAAMASPPEWMPTNVIQWRSQARLAALVRKWGENRFAGDEEAFATIDAWREHDDHLWRWETSQRKKALLHRREVYRIFAASMARQYRSVVLEQFDLRQVAVRPTTENQEGDNESARANRQKSAVSELRLCLTQAFSGRVEWAPAEFTTMQHAACGSIQVWDQAKHVRHVCTNCGVEFDQDENAAENLLAYVAPTIIATSDEKDPESRWTKARRMGEEKKARVMSRAAE